MLCKFEVAGRTDQAWKIKGQQLKDTMGTLRCFIKGVLVQLAEAGTMKMEDSGLSSLVAEVGGLASTSRNHVGGDNEMYKRHLAMLG